MSKKNNEAEKYILYDNQVWKKDKLKKIKKRFSDWKYKNIHKIRDIVSSLKKIKNDLTYLDVMIDYLDTISENDRNEIIHTFEEISRISNTLSNKTREKKKTRGEEIEDFLIHQSKKEEDIVPSAPIDEGIGRAFSLQLAYGGGTPPYNPITHHNSINSGSHPPCAIPIMIG